MIGPRLRKPPWLAGSSVGWLSMLLFSLWFGRQEVRTLTMGTCRECELLTPTVVEIDGEQGDLGLARYALDVAQDPMGRYWVSFGERAPVTCWTRSGVL